LVRSSGRGMQTSEKGALSGVPIRVRRTLRKGSAEGFKIGGGFWRRQLYARSLDLLLYSPRKNKYYLEIAYIWTLGCLGGLRPLKNHFELRLKGK
jgi:hypothetical protein